MGKTNKDTIEPGTKKDAGTAIWASKLSPGCPLGFRKVLYYMTQIAVSRRKNCILGFWMKPHWFHKKLHTPISVHCKISVYLKPLWFHQELEYAICETILVSSEIGVCNKSVPATIFWPDGAPWPIPKPSLSDSQYKGLPPPRRHSN